MYYGLDYRRRPPVFLADPFLELLVVLLVTVLLVVVLFLELFLAEDFLELDLLALFLAELFLADFLAVFLAGFLAEVFLADFLAAFLGVLFLVALVAFLVALVVFLVLRLTVLEADDFLVAAFFLEEAERLAALDLPAVFLAGIRIIMRRLSQALYNAKINFHNLIG